MVLRGEGETRRTTPGSAGRDLLCALVSVGLEVVGRDAIGPRCGCDDARATLCGVGGERGVSGLCDSGGVDGGTRHGEACVAEGVVADAAPGADRRAAPLLGDWAVGSRIAMALSAIMQRLEEVATFPCQSTRAFDYWNLDSPQEDRRSEQFHATAPGSLLCVPVLPTIQVPVTR